MNAKKLISLSTILILLFTGRSISQTIVDPSNQSELLLTFLNDWKTDGSPSTMYIDTTLAEPSLIRLLLCRYFDDNKIIYKKEEIVNSKVNVIRIDQRKLEKNILLVDSIIIDSIKQKDAEACYKDVPLDSAYLYENVATPYYPIKIVQPVFYKDYAAIGFTHYTERVFFLYKRCGHKWERESYLYDPY